MATGDTIGLNRDFPIYNADGTAFNDLVLKKATVDSIIMSLGDKITGDVYYKDNTLAVTMQEYIEYKRNPDDEDEDAVKYMLINPPTVVREGMASDNGEMKGMTKYSFTFYHPMCLLANFPFSDVAVSQDQTRYLSENKTFSWIGTLQDYVEKLNKNLEGTQWIVVINYSSVAQEDYTKLSDVLTFDKQSIADALKTGYETWKVPYVVDVIKDGEAHYDDGNGKRFIVWFGLPTTDIYETDESSSPFVFKFGQGVGLKNNSRTPRNNKIITRIAGYGSEDNIPYGYPQIQWYGNQDWDYTINNDATDPHSYPIYKGIVGGAYVKLIKHPFTRTHLMPSVYVESLFNKISPYTSLGTVNANYDPDTELVDYYDAVNEEGETPEWENPIVADAPSYEIHEFTDIKPELGDMQLVAVETYDDTAKDAISMDEFMTHLNDYYSESENEDEKDALQRLIDSIAVNDEDAEWSSGTRTSYQYDWRFTSDDYFKYVTYKSSLLNFENTVLLNPYITPTPEWDDTMDDDGNYVQSYFKVTLPALGFDLYACAAITQEMSVNMRSGACIGCTFPVMVDWDDYKKNFYDADGNFDPVIGEGHPRDGQKYPDSTLASISVVLQKDNTTFGTLMPNIYQHPASGNKFVILGISLPQSYVTSAESRLDDDMIQYMHDNNVYYYDYPLKFDEHFLANHAYILSQMKPNTVVRFEYADETHALYIKQMTVKYGNKPLPEYNITLTDDVEIVLNQIGQVTQEVSNLRLMLGGGDGANTSGDTRYLRKDKDDTASGLISFIRGLQVGERFVTGLLGEGGIFRKDADGTTYLECDRMYVRMKAYFDTVEVRRFIHSGGNRVASAAGIKCSRVEYYTQNGLMTTDASEAAYFRCYFRANDNGTEITNDFEINDLAYCKETNKVGEQANTTTAVATRSASSNRSVSEGNITISLVITNDTNASVTLDGDARFVLSNPDVDGNYHGWQGSYNRTERMVFSNSAVTLAVGESRTVTLSGGLYRRSPAGDAALAEAGRRSNVLLYVGGVSEVVLCSKLSSSIVFQNGGTYNVSISQGGQGISQRFYWRKVIGVSSAVTSDGEHYIDISATDCATGSDVPIAQDDIIQLGNTTDTTRQGAIVEFVSGEDAPSYQIFQGINTYNLEAKNYISLGYNSATARAYMNVYGDMYVGSMPEQGETEGSTYIHYTQGDGTAQNPPRLKIKAVLDIESTVDNDGVEIPLEQFVDNNRVFGVGLDNVDSNGYPIPPYKKGDLWINANYTPPQGQTSPKYENEILVCIQDSSEDSQGQPVFSITDWALASDYNSYRYITDAIKAMTDGSTTIVGGLVLSSVIALRDTAATPNIWSGISGMYNQSAIGGGIAAWYGGLNIDKEAPNVDPTSRYAKSLFRFDGTGYLAGGNITWNANGSGSVAGGNLAWNENGQITSIAASNTITVGGSNVLTQSAADSRYVTIDFFNRLFQALDGSGNTITTNSTSGTINALKFLQSVWSTGAVSALGANGSGGGGSSLVLNNPLLSINGINANPSTANSLLVWNGTSWGYKTTSEIGSSYAATAGRLSDNASYTVWGQTFFTNGVPTSVGTSTTPAALSHVTNIDSILYFDTTNSKIGIGTNAPSSRLHISGKLTVENPDYTAAEMWGQLKLHQRVAQGGETDTYIVFGCFANTYSPFIRFRGSDGVTRDAIYQTSSNHLVISTADTDKQTFVYGSNVALYSRSVSNTTSMLALRTISGGRVFVGNSTTDGSGNWAGMNNTDTNFIVRGKSYLTERVYFYRPTANSDTGAVYLEWDSSSQSLKLNGSFYATGGVSALGIVGSGGSIVTLGNVLNHINTHDATSFSPLTDSVLLFRNGVWGSMTLSQLGASVTTDCVKTSGTQIIGGAKTFSDAITIGSNGSISSYNGFVIAGLSNADDYVLLAGGGHKALSEIGGGGGNYVTTDTNQDITGVKTFKANVTIGTSSTNNTLVIYGRLGVGMATDTTYTLKANNRTYLEKLEVNGAPATGISANLYVNGATYLNGATTVNNSLTIPSSYNLNANGSVGIGTTAQSGYKLYVSGDTRVTGTLTVGTMSFTNISASGTLSVGSTATAVSFIVSGYNSTYVLLSGSTKALSEFVQTSGNQSVAGNKTFSGSTTFSNSVGIGSSTSNKNLTVMGMVGINTSAGTYQLSVNGTSYFSNDLTVRSITFSQGSWSGSPDSDVQKLSTNNKSFAINVGTGSAFVSKNWSTGSDMRLKDIVAYIDNLTVEGVASAPVFKFTWKDSEAKEIAIGTSAQYWRNVLPNAVTGNDNSFLALDYNAVTIASVVATARKVVDHEHRIQQLEWENERLRKEIEQLKAA